MDDGEGLSSAVGIFHAGRSLGGYGPWEALGAGVAGFHVGDRVAFADSPFAHAELVAVSEAKLIPLPDDIPFDMAAAVLLQGLTPQYLVRDSHLVKTGESLLVHAAAGGVGLLLVQMATLLGAQVLGIVSKEAKIQSVLEAGAKDVVLFGDDWSQAARDFSGAIDERSMVLSEGVDVVYDSVGSTLAKSLEATRTGGHAVFFVMAGELFDWVRRGLLKAHIAARVPLSEGAEAHRLLESRNTTGKVLLIP